ncbi:MAG: efflux RND transporter periplasmic adaptor subunit [Lentisphaerae bacterium]|nr:efflux RND transporter periplasmic adaptor subunit [Lentisphaerota bacterium]
MNLYLRSSIGISMFVAAPHAKSVVNVRLAPRGAGAWITSLATALPPRLHEKVAEDLTYAGMFTLCCLLAVTLTACGKRPQGPPPRPPVVVQTAAAVPMDAPVIINAFGTTEDQQSVDIIPQVSGVLLKTFVQEGGLVTNGQALFQIDERDYVAQVRQAEGRVAAGRANLELSRGTLERNRELHEQNMISSESFDLLKTKLAAAQAQLQIDEAALDLARLNLGRCTLVAPLAGVCSKLFVDDGNLVAAHQTRLTNVRSYDPLYVEFSASEQYLAVLRAEFARGPLRLEVNPRGSTNSYAGELTFLDNAVNHQSGTILLRGRVPNPELTLWSGQFVEVRVFAGEARAATMVPESAVQFGKDGPYLFVVTKSNQAELRLVKPGVRYNNRLQIIEGVTPGEKVIVLGQLMLFPGANVVDAAQAAPPGAGSDLVGIEEGK